MNIPRVRLSSGETALFGYGSLCSIASLERSLGYRYQGPFLRCSLAGWRRTWDVGMPNKAFFFESSAGPVYPEHILYLNVSPDPDCLLNGVLFVVNAAELERYDEREWIYDRRRITDQLRDVDVDGGDAYVYVAKPEYVIPDVASPAQAAIRKSYVNILEAAFQDLGEEFREAYLRSSNQPPSHLIIDDRQSAAASNPFSRPASQEG